MDNRIKSDWVYKCFRCGHKSTSPIAHALLGQCPDYPMLVQTNPAQTSLQPPEASPESPKL